ncbi:hypothetical protein VKT23_012362 [Stygiomarasmius scandens]|uniref:Uncharacterized protein n=1 Tax=Marasmiellus scandens TaxID=2682957 RepID=A0ABR1J6J5_9AGAR
MAEEPPPTLPPPLLPGSIQVEQGNQGLEEELDFEFWKGKETLHSFFANDKLEYTKHLLYCCVKTRKFPHLGFITDFKNIYPMEYHVWRDSHSIFEWLLLEATLIGGLTDFQPKKDYPTKFKEMISHFEKTCCGDTDTDHLLHLLLISIFNPFRLGLHFLHGYNFFNSQHTSMKSGPGDSVKNSHNTTNCNSTNSNNKNRNYNNTNSNNHTHHDISGTNNMVYNNCTINYPHDLGCWKNCGRFVQVPYPWRV